MAVALVVSGMTSTSYAATTSGEGPQQIDPETDVRVEPPEAAALTTSVAPSERAEVLGADWEDSTDRVWTLMGDPSGLHVMTAHVAEALEWRTVATLQQDGFDTDRWVGNACLTGSGDRLVVAYAPRSFTNDAEVFRQGAFTAVVNLDDGNVTELPLRGSLEYFTPSCGHGDDAVVTVSGGDEIAATRLVAVDAAEAEVASPVEAPGQLTSAVLTNAGLVAAVGHSVARIEPTGKVVPLVRTKSVPYELTTDASGGLVFLDHDGTTATARRLDARRLTVSRVTIAAPALASAPLEALGVTRTRTGDVVLTGAPRRLATLPAHVSLSSASRGAEVSADGSVLVDLSSLATTAVALDGSVDATAPLTGLSSTIINRTTGATATIEAVVQAEPQSDDAVPELPADATEPAVLPTEPLDTFADGSSVNAAASAQTASFTAASARTTSVTATSATAASGDNTDPVDSNHRCAVARNSVHSQAMQPKPRQVEWAVNQAVKGALTVARPRGWKNLGMAAYQPQTMFPPVALSGGGEVPAQIMLGILAQESNLWQAPGYVVPGVTGSPLIGNYYGVDRKGDESDQWDPNFIAADCGYGVAQVTDGMRRGDTGMPGGRSLAEQRAIALDYAANVAAGLQILQEKWNQTREGGLTINDGNPARIENWFFAVWAYNSGYYPESAKNTDGRNGAWGVGWSNNPANPSYAPFRSFFHADPYDATHPQDWPYPEKVIGFAAYPPALLESPDTFVAAYRAAWWPGDDDSTKPNSATRNRAAAKPPVNLFCNASNHCLPEVTGSSLLKCTHRDAAGQSDYRCWYNGNATWKTDCASQCGRPFIRFPLGYAYQEDGIAYPPVCTDVPLPATALIVDDVPRSAPVVRPGCTRTSADAGTFTMTFSSGDDPTEYPSKMDLHQLGAGYGGHFWFGHTRQADLRGGEMEFTGTWRLAQPLQQWTRIMVHIPDHGAHTRQAEYVIDPGKGRTQRRTLLQRTQRNGWVSLGVFEVDGVPSVSLSTATRDGDYETADGNRLPAKNEDIAFDAVAFVPLDAKPTDFVVALGDSYSSGEGAGTYYAETDTNKSNPRLQNGCHRSPLTWSRMGTLAGSTAKIGQRADSLDATLDYHLLACSGAFVENVTNRAGQAYQRFGERTQIARGFLDENTTLVTMSIGGNDAGFQGVIISCAILSECHTRTADDGTTYGQRIQRTIDHEVGPDVTDLLEEIHDEAPNARVLLMGYPKLFSGRCELITKLTLSEGEVGWMNDLARVLAERLSKAAVDANARAGTDYVTFTDPRPAFEGRGICGTPEHIHAGVLTPTDGDMLVIGSQQSFHPKAEGYLDYAWAMDLTLNPPVP